MRFHDPLPVFLWQQRLEAWRRSRASRDSWWRAVWWSWRNWCGQRPHSSQTGDLKQQSMVKFLPKTGFHPLKCGFHPCMKRGVKFIQKDQQQQSNRNQQWLGIIISKLSVLPVAPCYCFEFWYFCSQSPLVAYICLRVCIFLILYGLGHWLAGGVTAQHSKPPGNHWLTTHVGLSRYGVPLRSCEFPPCPHQGYLSIHF